MRSLIFNKIITTYVPRNNGPHFRRHSTINFLKLFDSLIGKQSRKTIEGFEVYEKIFPWSVRRLCAIVIMLDLRVTYSQPPSLKLVKTIARKTWIKFSPLMIPFQKLETSVTFLASSRVKTKAFPAQAEISRVCSLAGGETSSKKT